MNHRFLLAGATLFSCATWAHAVPAPPKTITDTKISNVYETGKLEPTPQRIAALKLPPGFFLTKFAEMQNPRMIAVASDGTVYISQRESGTLVMLKDTNRDGRADVQKVVAKRKWLHGVALRGNDLFFITTRELYRAPRRKDGTLGTPVLITKDLPDAGQHPNRTIAFGPDKKLYISVGSTCNACEEPNEENATMLVADSDGRNRKIFASGLRNTIGFGWHPASKRFFGWDHGIDELGDDVQKEELNELKQGKRYGWPYIYENDKAISHPQPPPPYSKEMWAKMSQRPALMYTAHSAGLQMAFYTGKQFPARYRNDAFIVLRGSWNRNPPSGYEVARIRFNAAGSPTKIEPFITGFLQPGASGGKMGHIARLAGLAQMTDGSMLIGDDANGIVYRLSYKAPPRPTTTAMDARRITFNLPESQNAPARITVRAASFPNNGLMGFHHTAYGKNQSPTLRWSGVPANAKSLVLMMEDPDAVNPKPFVHWLVANISPRQTILRGNLGEGDTLPQIPGAMQGAAHTAKIGYFGPKPPADGKAHHYHFQIFALNKKLALPSGYNRQALLDAMRGHVIAKGQTVGQYKRTF
ncbi:MAG TPA: YbhB/YbcL family Raf kinase inhibitor-like protein [Abditibacteriaceae bacterium]|jgi:Raf kinase inhibitor-like YbhB/YbcL family protein